MSRNAIVAVVVVVLLIMFAPVVFADSVERFFDGLGTILSRFGDGR